MGRESHARNDRRSNEDLVNHEFLSHELFWFRDVDAQGGRQVDLVLLLLHQDFTDMLGEGVFTQRIALPDALAIISDCRRLIFQIKMQHFLGFFRRADFLGMDRGHSAEIINLFRDDQGMAQLFLCVFPRVRRAMFMCIPPFKTCEYTT